MEKISKDDAKSASKPTVAEYLTAQIALRGRPQAEIAAMCGFPKANMISMIKQGKSLLPIAKVGLMAKALGIDPTHLYKMVMQEYQPSNWEALQYTIFREQEILTDNEREILDVIRQSKTINPKIRTEQDRIRVLDAINSLKSDNATND